jgi:hypothetical protein
VTSLENQFCTLATVGYLPRVLVLYSSLKETCPGACLRVGCMDTRTERLLSDLALPQLVPIGIHDVESSDPRLPNVKSGRSELEYALTAKPSVCLYVLNSEPQLEGITYLDADLMFFDDFAPLMAGMDKHSIMIVPHRYPPEHEWMNERWGLYNAGTITFRRDRIGFSALAWWRERCIEWCFTEPVAGKWTDQRYLDDWPERFEGVKVLAHPGGGLAPWNASRYRLTLTANGLNVSGYPLIFYHYHGLALYRSITLLRRIGLFAKTYRLLKGRSPWVWNVAGVHTVSEAEATLLWDPYLSRLRSAVTNLQRFDPSVSIATTPGFHDYFGVLRRRAKLRSRLGLKRALR